MCARVRVRAEKGFGVGWGDMTDFLRQETLAPMAQCPRSPLLTFRPPAHGADAVRVCVTSLSSLLTPHARGQPVQREGPYLATG